MGGKGEQQHGCGSWDALGRVQALAVRRRLLRQVTVTANGVLADYTNLTVPCMNGASSS